MNTSPHLQDLYQHLVLDHGRNPRNFGVLEGADSHADGDNPLCGDRVTVFLKRIGDRIGEIRFTGRGCAICLASASLMTQTLKDKSPAEAESLFHAFQQMLAADGEPPASLGKLAVFSGVRGYPLRIKCATLPWHTFLASLKYDSHMVSTE